MENYVILYLLGAGIKMVQRTKSKMFVFSVECNTYSACVLWLQRWVCTYEISYRWDGTVTRY